MIQVTKRDGRKETLDIEKLHKVVFHACNDITGVSPSEVEIKSQIQFFNGMKSSEIQDRPPRLMLCQSALAGSGPMTETGSL